VSPEVESVSLSMIARDDEIAAVERAFADAGFEVEARPEVETPADDLSASSLPWLVYVVVTVPIGAFFAGFGHAAGKDVWDAVKRWVREIAEVHERSHYAGGELDVRDPLGTRLVLSAPVRDEALDALANVDWDSVDGGDLHWDDEHGEWRRLVR
jgi:hypothetical protein